MSRLHFSYCMDIEYEKEVSKCYFTVKCIPRNDMRQKLIMNDISIVPETTTAYGMDSFGNSQVYGCISEPHMKFHYSISGIVETCAGYYVQDVAYEQLGKYKYPHGKCIPQENIIGLHTKIGNLTYQTDIEKAQAIMDFLYHNFKYEAMFTNAQTTAEEALKVGKGVCQDYAHIFITLLRMSNIPARYVCGFIVGEGESHAWVEAACNGQWIAFDPTYNCMIAENYIKTGDGRDAADCAINRGIMWGGGAQIQKISVSVEACDDSQC